MKCRQSIFQTVKSRRTFAIKDLLLNLDHEQSSREIGGRRLTKHFNKVNEARYLGSKACAPSTSHFLEIATVSEGKNGLDIRVLLLRVFDCLMILA